MVSVRSRLRRRRGRAGASADKWRRAHQRRYGPTRRPGEAAQPRTSRPARSPDWTAEGDAFEGQPIEGDTVRRRRGDMQSGHAGPVLGRHLRERRRRAPGHADVRAVPRHEAVRQLPGRRAARARRRASSSSAATPARSSSGPRATIARTWSGSSSTCRRTWARRS